MERVIAAQSAGGGEEPTKNHLCGGLPEKEQGPVHEGSSRTVPWLQKEGRPLMQVETRPQLRGGFNRD